MEVKDALTGIIRPALSALPQNMRGEKAEILLLAIGLQESRFTHRKQIKGPARGFWQFEPTGVNGVWTHPASRLLVQKLCAEQGANSREQAYKLLENNDILACQLARLLLWTDPMPLPDARESLPAWHYYLRNWRPGKPHQATWTALHDRAVLAVTGQ